RTTLARRYSHDPWGMPVRATEVIRIDNEFSIRAGSRHPCIVLPHHDFSHLLVDELLKYLDGTVPVGPHKHRPAITCPGCGPAIPFLERQAPGSGQPGASCCQF